MAESDDDWRLMGQEKYLKGAKLIHQRWQQHKERWDHDHCEFCQVKFSELGDKDVLREGYSTEDQYHWVCDDRAKDFEERFEFTLIN